MVKLHAFRLISEALFAIRLHGKPFRPLIAAGEESLSVKYSCGLGEGKNYAILSCLLPVICKKDEVGRVAFRAVETTRVYPDDVG